MRAPLQARFVDLLRKLSAVDEGGWLKRYRRAWRLRRPAGACHEATADSELRSSGFPMPLTSSRVLRLAATALACFELRPIRLR